jgi:NRPS condensation-like uncharacterized protein
MTVRSNLSIYNNVAVTARYKRNCTGSLKPAVFSALATVIRQHPILSAIPVDTNTSSPYFVRLPFIDLNQVVAFMENEGFDHECETFQALDRFLQTQHSRPFQYTTPLSPFWKLHVWEEVGNDSHFMLSFFFHHCIADTKSALAFHEAIEDALNVPSETKTDCMVRTSTMALLPPLDDFLDKDSTTSPSTYQEQPSDVWTGAVQFTPARTRFCSRWLASGITKQLFDITKQERLSLTAILQTILVAAIFQCLPSEYTTIKADCAISLRPWLPSPVTATSIGCFIDSFSETYQRSPFSWNECHRTKKAIERVLQQKRGDDLCGNLHRIPDLKSWLEKKMGQARPSALELSNVGKLTPSTLPKEYEIESLLFSQSAGACSGAIKVSAATGRDGRLIVGFSYQEGVVEDGMVENVIQGFESILREVLCNGQGTA